MSEHVKARDLVGWGGHCIIECSCGWKTESRVIGEAARNWQRHLERVSTPPQSTKEERE